MRPAPLQGVTVLQSGLFDPDYARNRLIRRAVEAAGATVVVHHDPRGLLRRSAAMARTARNVRADITLVSFPGHSDVLPNRLARPRTPIVWDALMSMYETSVIDRATVKRRSARGAKLRFDDWVSARLADVVLLDTDAHARFFADRFGGEPSKYRRVWIGTDEAVMVPAPPRVADGRTRVVFYGTFIPLQGVEHIIDAAALVGADRRDIEFELIGTGQTYNLVRRRAQGLSNVRFVDRMPFADLARAVAGATFCLGIFGTSEKAQRVIPNKVFDALSVGRAVITADTVAIREVFEPGENIVTCPPGDPHALAAAITALADEPARRERIAASGRALFTDKFSLAALAPQVADVVLKALR